MDAATVKRKGRPFKYTVGAVLSFDKMAGGFRPHLSELSLPGATEERPPAGHYSGSAKKSDPCNSLLTLGFAPRYPGRKKKATAAIR